MTDITINSHRYKIPDELEINPALIIHEELGYVRVAVGKPDIPEDQKEAYTTLISELTRIEPEPYVQQITFTVGTKILSFRPAYITVSEKSFGTFVDIETTLDGYTYKEKSIKDEVKDRKKPRSKSKPDSL